MLGVRGRGNALATAFAERPDCRVAWLCDADRSLLAAQNGWQSCKRGRRRKPREDFRKRWTTSRSTPW